MTALQVVARAQGEHALVAASLRCQCGLRWSTEHRDAAIVADLRAAGLLTDSCPCSSLSQATQTDRCRLCGHTTHNSRTRCGATLNLE